MSAPLTQRSGVLLNTDALMKQCWWSNVAKCPGLRFKCREFCCRFIPFNWIHLVLSNLDYARRGTGSGGGEGESIESKAPSCGHIRAVQLSSFQNVCNGMVCWEIFSLNDQTKMFFFFVSNITLFLFEALFLSYTCMMKFVTCASDVIVILFVSID